MHEKARQFIGALAQSHYFWVVAALQGWDETSVVRIHSGSGPHEEMDQRAIACFDQALEDVGLATNECLRRVLHDYFAWATTTTMSRYQDSAEDVPDGLHIPKWSWHGLVSEPRLMTFENALSKH